MRRRSESGASQRPLVRIIVADHGGAGINSRSAGNQMKP